MNLQQLYDAISWDGHTRARDSWEKVHGRLPLAPEDQEKFEGHSKRLRLSFICGYLYGSQFDYGEDGKWAIEPADVDVMSLRKMEAYYWLGDDICKQIDKIMGKNGLSAKNTHSNVE